GGVRAGRGAGWQWEERIAEGGLAGARGLPALWDLVGGGEVTNAGWGPLRAARRNGLPAQERRPRRFSRRRSGATSATQGRWTTTERLFAPAPDRRAPPPPLVRRQGGRPRGGARGERGPRGPPAGSPPGGA